jgi:hypothetical protein
MNALTARGDFGGLWDGDLSADEHLMLDNWAVEESAPRWRLERDKAIAAIERGHDAAQVSLLIECVDPETADLIAAHKNTARLLGYGTCVSGRATARHRSGNRHIVAPSHHAMPMTSPPR